MADDKSDNRAALIEGDVSKALRGLAVPMMVGIVSILAVNLIDTYFVGQLGTAELAAMSFTFPVVGLVFSVAMGLGIGATSTVARALGGGDTRVVKRLTTHAMLLAVLVVAIVSGVGIATQRPVFELLGAEPELIPLLEEYMTIWYAGVILLVVPMVGNGIMRATGDARTPALSMMTAAVINLILDPLFIFGLGPIPGMGLQGAAIATLLSRVVVMFFALYVLTVRLNLLEFRLPPLGELLDSWRKILSVGLPAAITNILAPIAAAVLTAIVASEGSTAVAGYGIGVRLEGFLLIAPMALASSLTPFVGQNWGAMRTERVDQALVISRNFVLLWGAAAWLILLVGGGTVAGIFSDDPAVIGAAQTYLWVVPLSYGAHGLVSVASATFNAVDRALRSTWLSALRSLVLAIPLAYAGGQLFGLTGVFGGIAVATMLSAILAYLWLRRFATADMHVEDALAAEPVAAAADATKVSAAALARVELTVETAIDALLDQVSDLDDISVRARPVNILAFYIGAFEVGHVHRSGCVDLRYPPAVHDLLIAEGRAEHHRHWHDASWLTCRLEGLDDASRAAWLLRLSQTFGRLVRAPEGDPGVQSELDALDLSPALRDAVLSATHCIRESRHTRAAAA